MVDLCACSSGSVKHVPSLSAKLSNEIPFYFGARPLCLGPDMTSVLSCLEASKQAIGVMISPS
jgi:hypothetical protein